MKKNKGQATVEYLMVFIIATLISVQLYKSMIGLMGENLGNFSRVLSGQLSVGVCEATCFFDGYVN